MVHLPAEAVGLPLEALKQRLVKGRADVAALHRDGALGQQVCSALCELTDRIVTSAYGEALERIRPADRPVILDRMALAAVGGYGRGDLAPFSDIDLLFLVDPREDPAVKQFVSGLVRDLWDIGLKLSQSVRSPVNCVAMARQDMAARTAMGEARLLAGHAPLFEDMQRRMHRFLASASTEKFLAEVLEGRAKEHEDYYTATVCLLEPNVKKSPGGLRDLHMLRWVGVARYGAADPEMLRLEGHLTARDLDVINQVSEYLLHMRHELHFRAGSTQDTLTRDEQLRLAQWLKYEDEGQLLAVERFMQQYYRRTTELHDVVMRFVDRARRRSMLDRVLARLLHRRVEEFLLRRDRIVIDSAHRSAVFASPERMLRMFDLARDHGLTIAHDDLENMRTAMPDCTVTGEARTQFLHLLGKPLRIGEFLDGLHRVGLLNLLIPAFEHTHCLIQFNMLHKFTVDKHTLLAVECAAQRINDRGPLGQAYREIHRKDLLHLALLCHDLGKGLGEDHSEVGKRIAEQVAVDFCLSPHDSELLVMLVHQHLQMAQTAFRRDINDERTLVQFTRATATPEALRMLYVLTAADTEAVAPGYWTAWKESLLTDLYARAMEELAGEAQLAGRESSIDKIRADLVDALHIQFPLPWLEQQLLLMPFSYLSRAEPARVAADLRILKNLGPHDVRVNSEYLAGVGLTQFTVITRDDLTPGIFSKIAGVLAAARFEILGAQIITRPDGCLIDTFQGIDTDFTGEPPPERRADISENIRKVLLGEKTVESLFRNQLRRAAAPAAARVAPAQVEIDNDSSDRFTIVEVFSDDRQGLLYEITRTLFELGLSVYSARISTHIDQVVDVFYVATQQGEKISDEAEHDHIRARLLVAVNA